MEKVKKYIEEIKKLSVIVDQEKREHEKRVKTLKDLKIETLNNFGLTVSIEKNVFNSSIRVERYENLLIESEKRLLKIIK